MSDSEIPSHLVEDGELDNPIRAIIVVNSPDLPEGEMEERLLDSIQSFEDMNSFFDKFDETVAIPNEEHIKYEVGSDGMVVVLVDSQELKTEVVKFFDAYIEKGPGPGPGPKKATDAEDETSNKKKKKI